MSNHTIETSSEVAPFFPVIVLLGGFVLLLAVLFSGQERVEQPEAAVSEPQPTEAAIVEATPEVTATEASVVVTTAYDAAVVEQGRTRFQITCSACHGVDAHGMPGLGKDMIASEFIGGLNDEELLEFVKVGRQPWDVGNTTGVAMPPKGGDPTISDDELMAVIAYIRTLRAAAGQ
jgi:mono/diheme cytochrome c family protein